MGVRENAINRAQRFEVRAGAHLRLLAGLCALQFISATAHAASQTINHRVDQPNVRQLLTAYPAVRFQPGDRITVSAGGCVQTGGHGKTWKRYVNPSGQNSERLYSGTISIQGVTKEAQRIGMLLGSPLQIPANSLVTDPVLYLGYQDDDYDDNSYDDHDDGTEDQCRGIGPAWVTVKIERGFPANKHQTYRIDQPKVDQSLTTYSYIQFSPGDQVKLEAGGCVQTGGHGQTWKRYVDPSGGDSDKYYSGTVSIEGLTDDARRIGDLLGRTLQIPSRPALRYAYLRLGYQDDNYSDNSYLRHDDGTGNQCRGQGAAWVRIDIDRGKRELPVPLPRYNEIYQRSSHNAYVTGKGSLYQQLSARKIRSIELDIHENFTVGHTGPGNDTTCATLAACLDELKRFHVENPYHEVVTVFIDPKVDFGPNRQPEQFDQIVRSKLGLNSIYRPADLVGRCRQQTGTPDMTLAGAAENPQCGWPALQALRGRFIFAITSDGGIPGRYFSAEKADAAAERRLAFIGPGASEIGRSYAVFFNLQMHNNEHLSAAPAIVRSGRIARIWGQHGPVDFSPAINEEDRWQAAVNAHVQHIATDEIGRSWTVTQNTLGWPFRCMKRYCGTFSERLGR